MRGSGSGIVKLSVLVGLAGVPAAFPQGQPFHPDLAKVAAGSEGRVSNRAVTATERAGQPAMRFDEREGDGLVVWTEVEFGDGSIEFDVRGKDEFQKSFVGVAFHGQGEAYEAVYFRPFNFRASDPARRSHAVQYVSQPEYTWERLRGERPGRYEKPLEPAPDPNGWVHARIVVAFPKVSVYVNDAQEPGLVVEELSGRRTGWIGLWVGNGSGGEFAGFKVSAVALGKKAFSLLSAAVPDSEPAVTAHLRATIQEAMRGAMKAEDYTPELWSQLAPMQKEVQADLQRHGELISMTLVDRQEEQGRRSCRYILEFKNARALEHFVLDEHGRIALLQSEGGETKSQN